MKPLGYYIEPPGPYGLTHRRPYYGIRWHERLRCLQVLVTFLDQSLVWINIDEHWLEK